MFRDHYYLRLWTLSDMIKHDFCFISSSDFGWSYSFLLNKPLSERFESFKKQKAGFGKSLWLQFDTYTIQTDVYMYIFIYYDAYNKRGQYLLYGVVVWKKTLIRLQRLLLLHHHLLRQLQEERNQRFWRQWGRQFEKQK